MMQSLGFDLFEDCLLLNAVNCKPASRKPPEGYEVECCRKRVLEAVEEYKPKLIILLGGTAVLSLIGHRWKKDLEGISKWRGWTIPDQELGSWVCPMFHPSFVERSETTDVRVIWKRDLKQALALIDVPFPRNNIPRINILGNDISILNQIQSKVVAFDYETTGLKPHAKGHRIVCASVAISPDNVFVFMMPRNPSQRQPFLNLLSNPAINKMAHNMKFEDIWTSVRLKHQVQSWYWDSMQAAHILDNRPRISGLKFQAYVHFGEVDYSSEISPYLKGIEDKNDNSLNRIQELIDLPGGVEKLMNYCAMDSIWEYRLAMKQQKLMNYDESPF
jgi:uracil-DNA glycosylase family 4